MCPIDKLDEACTNVDDRIMLVRHRSGRPSHEVAWIWTDFLSEQRQATDFVEPAEGQTANESLHDARTRQVRNTFMAKKLLHRCICAHAQAHMHFLRRVCMHLDWCLGHQACAGVYVRRKL